MYHFMQMKQVIIENKKAVGVEVIKNGKRQVIKCNKEVVLSAGSIKSPQILMLSGVGPREHLREHGVKTHSNSFMSGFYHFVVKK